MINIIIIEGRIGSEIEIRATSNGTDVAEFRVAANLNYRDREDTDWFRVVVFGDRGRWLRDKANKGDRIVVSGRLEVEKWNDRDTGQPRTGLKIVAQDWSWPNPPMSRRGDGYNPQGGTESRSGFGEGQSAGESAGAMKGQDSGQDDLPF